MDKLKNLIRLDLGTVIQNGHGNKCSDYFSLIDDCNKVEELNINIVANGNCEGTISESEIEEELLRIADKFKMLRKCKICIQTDVCDAEPHWSLSVESIEPELFLLKAGYCLNDIFTHRMTEFKIVIETNEKDFEIVKMPLKKSVMYNPEKEDK